MSHNSEGAGYFLYHSIGLYPGKEEAMANAMAEFARVWSAPNDAQWGYVMGKRQAFIDHWRQLINAPEGTLTTCETVTDGLHAIMRALPEGMLRGKRVLVTADCFPSLHFLLAGLAPRMGFRLDTVPLSEGRPWVETADFIDRWGPDVGLALLTWVTSIASARMDHAALVAHGRDMGSLIAVDITQAAGLLPFDARDPAVDFVLSTSLKWLCGAPGAGIIHADATLLPELQPEARGWFSQENPFSWDLDAFSYAPDIRRFDTGTPPSVAALASLPGLEWMLAQDRAAIIAHNRRLVERIIARADDLGLPLHSPREAERRGGAVMMRLPDAERAAALVADMRQHGYGMDARGPVLRLSPGIVTQESAVDAVFDRMRESLSG
ncbi:MAG: aminotransferase class V-fold PLP-dependent enzyme [Rhodobacteraceae bacterium]|nr:aminotransferase class V-fold PLP-dependent enzyme [Paracoccaceae bacterium]